MLRTLDHDRSWWGIRHLKPAPGSPYRSTILLRVCLITGIPAAAIVYGAANLALKVLDTFGDDTNWLPRASAWAVFVLNGFAQSLGCWLWNRRRRNPTRRRHVE
jgi:hypothetical protein